MKTLNDHLAQYAAYHRDPRNIQTHFIGVPMIMLGVTVLLSRPEWSWGGGVPMSPAVLAALASCAFYARLDLRYASVMAVVLAAMVAVGHWLAGQSTALWLGAGVGLFAVGWVIQFVGHFYEGRKPAFVDDLVGLLIGPLFVVAELGFALGLRRSVQDAVHERSGPVRLRVGTQRG
ncbi:DUF962 domain-containing protein [Acidovorax sp. Leaf160]|uniref:Mpo1 family 2-hydroxy fatty acid dioxygenase n=1 Tax=Acidovorax sp. Leaf160 TaxID=1736280 RepID=UPI0006FCFE58|nr:Mpo1-like protein [Acidovorax sp. Leaf160]KQR55299.1 hypothetical protein ASF94_02235 [Acidovorax sp. Leaf160]